LQAQLKAEQARTKEAEARSQLVPSSEGFKKPNRSESNSEREVEVIVEESSQPPPLVTSRKAPHSRYVPEELSSQDQDGDVEVVAKPKKSTKQVPAVAKGKKQKVLDDDSEIEIVEPKPPVDRKGKRKAEILDDSANHSPESLVPKKRSKKPAPDDANEDDSASSKPRPKPKPKARAATESTKPLAKTKTKPQSKPPREDVSVSVVGTEEGTEGGTTPKKKKRKINLFPLSKPTSFEWDQLAPSGSSGKLDIPTVLSPVKETDMTAQKSSRGIKVSSTIGSFGPHRRR